MGVVFVVVYIFFIIEGLKCGVFDKKLLLILKKFFWKDIKKVFFIFLKFIMNFRVIFYYMFFLIIVYCLVLGVNFFFIFYFVEFFKNYLCI